MNDWWLKHKGCFQQKMLLMAWGLIWIKVESPSLRTWVHSMFRKTSPKNEFIQIPSPRCFSRQVPEGCSSLAVSEQLMGLLTGWTVDPLWAAQSGSDWGVNNCIVLSCYSCCSSPACLVCPSEQQMTRTQCGWRRNVSERSPLQQPGSCESTWHGNSRSTLPSSANESHFVWLPLPWCGGIFFFFWEYTDGF